MIGVFDSGLGGLSVWNEIINILPSEQIVYFADSGYCPYGNRTREDITQRVKLITDFLISKGVSLIVVACNTVTAASIDYLRENYTIPFVGMEPAVKPAILKSKSGVVGVLATKGTLNGALYKRTLNKYKQGTIVLEQAGEGLVELVEAGETSSAKGRELLERYLLPMLEQGADHIVLGCTHYPFLTKQIREIAGSEVEIVNPAPAVARRTAELLAKNAADSLCNAQSIGNNSSKYTFYTTGANGDIIKKLAACSNCNFADCIHTVSL